VAWIFKKERLSLEETTRLRERVLELESGIQASEASFHSLVSAFPEPVWLLDGNLKPLHWNQALVALSRKDHLSEAEFKTMSIHAWFREPEVQGVLERGLQSPSRVEFETDGKYFEISCSPFQSDGKGAGVIAVFHEVTLLKRAEQARVDLVVNVSHELRTPLTAIKGFVDTLKEDLEGGRWEGAFEYVSVISRNADRLMALIQDLLLLSRLESGADALAMDFLSTQEITEKALQGLRPIQEKMGHAIEMRIDALQVRGDALRIEQVLVNLVGNALRYAPAASGPIEVIWRNDGDSVVLEVADQGPGIPEELQPRIFERFYRGDAGRSRDMGGTGLGLAIVKHILIRHGGSVELKSSAGMGSRFICRFPADARSIP